MAYLMEGMDELSRNRYEAAQKVFSDTAVRAGDMYGSCMRGGHDYSRVVSEKNMKYEREERKAVEYKDSSGPQVGLENAPPMESFIPRLPLIPLGGR